MDIFFGGKKRTKMLEKGEGAFFILTLNTANWYKCIIDYEMLTEGQDGYNYWDWKIKVIRETGRLKFSLEVRLGPWA